jgi:Flp pilus assembly CpaE family ATPase/tetratricopeptide (TPR) repeat protein
MAALPKQITSGLVSVGVLGSTQEVCLQLHACLRRLPIQLIFNESAGAVDSAHVSRLQSLRPELLLVEQPADRAAIPSLIKKLRAALPGSPIILVNRRADSEAILEAIRAGARDYLYPPFDQALANAVLRLEATLSKTSAGVARAESRVVGFLSVKGGCGATTVATHAAVSLARESGKPTGLADFDLTCGMVRFLTKAQNPHTVVDAANNAHRLDDSFWGALVSRWPGVEVLASPGPSAAANECPDAAEFGRVLQFMRSRYAWSLIDLGRGVQGFSVSLLNHFDELFLVTTPDRIALSQAKRVADCLRHGCGFRAIHLVINRAAEPGAIPVGEIEALTGLDVYATLADSGKEMHQALLAGRLMAGNTRLGGQIRLLTRRLAGLPTSGSQRVSGLVSEGCKLWARVLKSATGRGKSGAAVETMREAGWKSLSRAGEDAFKSGQFQMAAKHFSQAVEEAEQFGEGDARLGKTLNRLGTAQCELGRYPEAVRSLKRAARILERALDASDPSVLEVLFNLAGAYKATREFQAAKQLYDRVLGAAEDLAGPAHSMTARILDGLGDLHVARGEPTAALYAYRRALSIKEQALGPGDWDVAVTLDKLGDFYCDQGRYNEAEPVLWRSLEIRKTVLGIDSPALGKLYVRLGSLYATQRKFARAERLLRYGISMSSPLEQPDEVVPHLRKLAEVYEGLARFGEAEAVRELAQSILSTAPGAEKALAREFVLTRMAVPPAANEPELGWAQATR